VRPGRQQFRRVTAGVLWTLLLVTGLRGEEKLDVRFEAGYGGVLPDSAAVVPVEVTIQNRLKNLTGRIEILNPGQTLSSEVTQVTPFKSSAPSILRYDLLARLEPGQGRTLEVRVVFDDKIPPVVKRWSPRSAQQLILAVGVPDAYLEQRDDKDQKAFFSEHYQLVRLSPAALPAQSLGYDGAFAVFISGPGLGRLSRPQLQALGEWVLTGGRLFLYHPASGDEFAKHLGTLGLPAVDGYRTGVWAAGAGFVAAQVLADAREKPFWVHPAHRRAAELFLPKLNRTATWSASVANSSQSGHFTNMTRRESTYGLSGFLWLLFIIVAYIAVIGPVDYWIVRRTKKPWLTWIIFSGAIVVFSLIAYWYSNVIHSGSMQAIQITVADADTDAKPLKGNSTFWLYSTKNSVYTLTTPVPAVTFSARESQVASAVAWVKVRNGAQSTIEARIPIFSSKVFDAAWVQEKSWQVREVDRVAASGFVLPPQWRIRRAYLATARGLAALDYDAQTQLWVPHRDPRSWALVLSDAAGFRRAYEALPSGDDLERYLLSVSFGDVPLGENYDEVYTTRAERGSRELLLDISPRVAGAGRVLLVFLEKDAALLPVNLDVLAPATIQANLVRVQLPPSAPAPTAEPATPEEPPLPD
jgi:hypothetical protein